jgi:hypothetical protein
VPTTFRTRAVALGLARRGWPVLPCHHPTADGCSCGHADCTSPGKHPRIRHGLHDATTEPTVIRRWWRNWPEANIAVRTGAAPAGAGVVVIDIDPHHGGEDSLTELQHAHEALPQTLEATTGGGGRHLWFTHPDAGTVPNSAGRLGAGIDVRGDGGYVLVSPSRHHSGGRYRWIDAPLAPLPDWLLRLCQPPAPTARPSVLPANVEAWARATLEAELTLVRAGAEGVRNHTLNRASFALGQLVGGGHLQAHDVADLLLVAASACGLSEREARLTIASGLQAGARQPRHPAGP